MPGRDERARGGAPFRGLTREREEDARVLRSARVSKAGAELLFELVSQRYERAAVLITSNLSFDEWTETFGSERLAGALLDRLTHHVHILEMNGESFRLNHSRARGKDPAG